MATNTSTEMTVLPASQCIPWLVVFIIEYLAVIVLNTMTIIVLVKNRQLQRRSTYLIIHLAIVDLLVGAVSGPLDILWLLGSCDLWRNAPKSLLLSVIGEVFPLASLVNLTAIALDRAHATFCPFKHRFMKKWVYAVVINVIWLTTAAGIGVGYLNGIITSYSIRMFLSILILLFVTTLSYISIFIKVRFNRQLHRNSAARNRERKLTSTLFIVAMGSISTWFPLIARLAVSSFHPQLFDVITSQSLFHVQETTAVLLVANSLINPIIYAMRMPELRQGIREIIFRQTPNRLNPVDIPLRNP